MRIYEDFNLARLMRFERTTHSVGGLDSIVCVMALQLVL